MIPLLLSVAAHAADDLQWKMPDDGFRVERGGAKVEVREIGMPKPIGIDPKFRTCRVSVRWVGGQWQPTVRDGCHPLLAETVTDAAGRWVLDVETPPARDRELFEYWYVFPEQRGDAVRVFVRQAQGQALRLAVEGLDPLEWGVKELVFVDYPPEAATQDTTVTTCIAKVDIASSGLPGEIAIEECDAVFHAPTADALRRWRFKTEELDGVPFPSGVTLAVKFTRAIEGEDPGSAEVLFPPDPDLGGRTWDRLEAPVAPKEKEPPPEPTWPALFVVDHRSYAEVGVYDVRWPEPLAGEADRTCDVLFQVNSRRVVLAWAERCDEEVRARVEEAANAWNLKHGQIERGERYARFRATFLFPADGGHVRLLVPEGDLRTPPGQLPEHVDTYAVAQAFKRVPPKLPRGFATEVLDARVTCEYEVTVDRSGRPTDLAVRACPGGYGPYAEKAIKQWRWTPAEADGKPIPSSTVVRVVFENPGVDGQG